MAQRKFISAQHKQALADHAQWLKSRGIRPPRGKLAGVPLPSLDVGSKAIPPTSNNMAYYWPKGSRDSMDASYRTAVEAKAATVAPSFNKGPLQPQTSTDFTQSRRRD